jgi:hypothetical protein
MKAQPKSCMTMRVSTWYVAADNRRGYLGHAVIAGV